MIKIFILTLLAINLIAQPLFSNHNQMDTSNYITSLKDLLIATQKTRGMTYTYLKGDSSVVFIVMNFRKEMKKALMELEVSQLGGDKVLKSREERLSDNLIRLNRNAMNMNPEKMFQEYTIEIENILVLANLAEIRSSENLNELGKLSVENLLKTALPLTEDIGQLRALGAGSIATLNETGSLDESKIKSMQILLPEIESVLREFEIGSASVSAHYSKPMDIDLKTVLSTNRADIDTFMQLTDKIFLKGESTTLTPQEYFEMGTNCINNLLKIFKLQNKAIMASSKGWF